MPLIDAPKLDIAVRMTREPDFHYEEMPWNEKLMWDMIKVYGAFTAARARLDTDPPWKKNLKKALKIVEAMLYIVAGIYAKRLL